MSSVEIKKTYGLIANPLNQRLVNDLRQKGEDVLIFPAVQPKRLDLTETAAASIGNPARFDWLVLTDVFAADFFIEALRERQTDFFELDDVTVCALGEAVADRLRFVQVHADVIPPSAASEAVFSTVSRFAFDGLGGLRFLVLREKSQELAFVESLRRERAAVEEVPVYEFGFANEPDLIKLKSLLKGGAVDEFVFSSPEEVLGLKFLFSNGDLREILKEVKSSATSEIVFQTLQENLLRPLYFHHK